MLAQETHQCKRGFIQGHLHQQPTIFITKPAGSFYVTSSSLNPLSNFLLASSSLQIG